jgi:hypothetical protein
MTSILTELDVIEGNISTTNFHHAKDLIIQMVTNAGVVMQLPIDLWAEANDISFPNDDEKEAQRVLNEAERIFEIPRYIPGDHDPAEFKFILDEAKRQVNSVKEIKAAILKKLTAENLASIRRESGNTFTLEHMINYIIREYSVPSSNEMCEISDALADAFPVPADPSEVNKCIEHVENRFDEHIRKYLRELENAPEAKNTFTNAYAREAYKRSLAIHPNFKIDDMEKNWTTKELIEKIIRGYRNWNFQVKPNNSKATVATVNKGSKTNATPFYCKWEEKFSAHPTNKCPRLINYFQRMTPTDLTEFIETIQRKKGTTGPPTKKQKNRRGKAKSANINDDEDKSESDDDSET